MEDGLILTAAAVFLIGIGVAVGICIDHDSFRADCDQMGRVRIGNTVYQCSPLAKPKSESEQ